MITIGRYFRISACRTGTTVWQAQTNWHWQQKGLYAASPELVYRLASIWRDFQSLGLCIVTSAACKVLCKNRELIPVYEGLLPLQHTSLTLL